VNWLNDAALGEDVDVPRSFLPRSFLDDVNLRHGPIESLGRFLLAAESQCMSRGVALSFGTFEELAAVNARNRDSWKPLFPSYDPRFHNFTPNNSVVILGRDAGGEIVTTMAGIRLQRGSQSLHDFTEALRVNYSDPDRFKRSGERCIVTAPSMKTLTGTHWYSGALWIHPSVRAHGLTALLGRIGRVLGHGQYGMDYAIAYMVEAGVKGGIPTRVGYQNVEWGIRFENSPMGSFNCAFAWMDCAHLEADIAAWLVEHAPSETEVLGRQVRSVA
jgi:hypothetical protein